MLWKAQRTSGRAAPFSRAGTDMTRARREKNSEEIKLWLGTTLKDDLRVIAAQQGFEALSPFIRHVLRGYAYGHVGQGRDLLAGAVRDE